MSEPNNPPEIPYPFPPGREPPRRAEPPVVPLVDLPAGEQADRLLERRTILISSRLDAAAVAQLCAQLVALDGRSTDDVELIVNSPGGPATAITAALDVIELMRATVNTTCVGAAEGTAVALIACTSGNRRAGPNARFRLRLEDEPAMEAPAAELSQQAEQLALCRQQLAAALSRASGQPADVIERELVRGGWHDAADAAALGLIDVVTEPRPR